MRIAITGALGLIGSSISLQLGQKFEIVNIDVRDLRQQNRIDICDVLAIKNALSECDGVIHLGAISRIAWGEQDPELCRKINVEGTKNIIDACLSSKKKPWLIFASSREVYGLQKNFPVTENCTPKPLNAYAQSKLMGENMVKSAHDTYGLKACIARFSNVYGGLIDHIDRVAPAFCVGAITGDDLKIYGPNCVYDFTHVDDVVDGIKSIVSLLILKETKELHKVHFTTGVPTSLFELAQIIIQETGSSSDVKLFSARNFATSKFYGDYTRAKNLFGWTPRYSIQEGVRKFIQDLKASAREEGEEFTLAKDMGQVGDEKISTKQTKQMENTIFMRGINENFKSYSWLPAAL